MEEAIWTEPAHLPAADTNHMQNPGTDDEGKESENKATAQFQVTVGINRKIVNTTSKPPKK